MLIFDQETSTPLSSPKVARYTAVGTTQVVNVGGFVVSVMLSHQPPAQGKAGQPAILTSLDLLVSEPVSQIHAYNGCEHTLIVTRSGRLVSFGYNGFGQLGGGGNKRRYSPQNIRGMGNTRVLTLSCSYYHTIVACVENRTFSFGRNNYGQLGHGDLFDKETAHEVKSLRGMLMTTLACGQYHTCAGASSGRVNTSAELLFCY
tara:strand:+ start:1089 stop:1697 length:609 start_codon:yes stop_codon:yes gene_type:complete